MIHIHALTVLRSKSTETHVSIIWGRQNLTMTFTFRAASHPATAKKFAEAVQGDVMDPMDVIHKIAKAHRDFGGKSPMATLQTADELLSWSESASLRE